MLGDRLKQIRKEKGLSQKAFADPLSTSSGYISEVEQGKKTPGSEFLISLSRVYGISIDWLLTGKGSAYLEASEDLPTECNLISKNLIEQEHMNLVKEFIDKQRALNIDKELIELEKLAPEVFERIESYIKGSVDTIKAVIEKDSKSCLDRRRGERRGVEDPEQIPDGVERRSGEDRRKAS